jgi:predicted acetyltransferase
MLKFNEYNLSKEKINFLTESRWKTHGLDKIRNILPRLLDSVNLKYDIDYNDDTDDFQIYIKNQNIVKNSIKNIVSICESIGYFPSSLLVDNLNLLDEFKKLKKNDDFIEYIKNYNFHNFNLIYIQFECWLDNIVKVPDFLYHVTDIKNLNKIKEIGLCPKSKKKISYHPSRIYLTSSIEEARVTKSEFEKIKKDKYLILKIDTNKIIDNDKKLKDVLKLRIDPNYENGYYTLQNINKNLIEEIN